MVFHALDFGSDGICLPLDGGSELCVISNVVFELGTIIGIDTIVKVLVELFIELGHRLDLLRQRHELLVDLHPLLGDLFRKE